MIKKYKLVARRIPSLPRNKRMRETGRVQHNGASASNERQTDPNSHTHGNKSDLDEISTDNEGYLYLTQRHGEELNTEKVKAGYADEAYDMAEDSPMRYEFVSRLKDDVAKGNITFEQAVKVLGLSVLGGVRARDVYSADADGKTTYSEGGLMGRGFGLYTDADGKTTLEADNIVARQKFTVNVLEIQKETFTGGNINLTNANGTIFRVYAYNADGYTTAKIYAAEDRNGNMVALSVTNADNAEILGETQGTPSARASYYKIYFTQTDGEHTVTDLWHNGDMAYVKTLNLMQQRTWHRVVTSHGTEVLEDGKEYNYIVVSNKTGLITVVTESGFLVTGVQAYKKDIANDAPMVGDKVVQYGSVTEIKRQGLTRIDSSGDGNGGVYVVEGVGRNIGTDRQFEPFRTPVKITPRETIISADHILFVVRNRDGEITGGEDAGEKMSYIEQKADKLTLKVKDDGGKNLLTGTRDLMGNDVTLYPEATMGKNGNGFTFVEGKSPSLASIDLIKFSNVRLKGNTTYILSFLYRGTPNSAIRFCIYSEGTVPRVCEKVWNSKDETPTQQENGETVINVTDEQGYSEGWVAFTTTSDFETKDDVTIIMGRMYGISNAGLCRPKLEYGTMVTSWRPSDNDDTAKLLDTGIDIESRHITLTSDVVEVQNNQGDTTALLDANGKIKTEVIDVKNVMTQGLNADQITATNLLIVGDSQFGEFKTNQSNEIENTSNHATDGVLIRYNQVRTGQYRNRDTNTSEKPYQETITGRSAIGGNIGESSVDIRMKEPSVPGAKMKGMYIDVAPRTIPDTDNGISNDAIYIKRGTICGLRPRMRRVATSADGETVQLTNEDYTVLINGQHTMKIVLPKKDDVQDGQRLEIRACAAVRNIITADAPMSVSGGVEQNQLKIFIYDARVNMWWVNVIN